MPRARCCQRARRSTPTAQILLKPAFGSRRNYKLKRNGAQVGRGSRKVKMDGVPMQNGTRQRRVPNVFAPYYAAYAVSRSRVGAAGAAGGGTVLSTRKLPV